MLKTKNMEPQETASESSSDDSNIGPTMYSGLLPPPYSITEYELQTVNMEQQAAASESSIADTNIESDLLPPSYSISELHQFSPPTSPLLPPTPNEPPPAYTPQTEVHLEALLPQQPDQQQQQVVLTPYRSRKLRKKLDGGRALRGGENPQLCESGCITNIGPTLYPNSGPCGMPSSSYRAISINQSINKFLGWPK